YQNIEGNLGSIERVYHDEQRDGSNHRSGRQLPNQFQMVFAEVFAPPVKAFIAEKLELLTLAREFSLTGNMWYLALTSGHDSLKKQAIQLFRQRLLGEDEEFNRVWGVAAESLHQRFQILMEPLFYALTEDHWAPDAEGALVGLVLSVEVDYSLVGPYLEQIYSVSSESHLKKIAGRLIGELKGLEYLESLPDLSLRKKFLIVNGGYSELSNYSVNEEDVKSFHYNLFHGQSVVLNAGGPGGTVVPISGGQSLRDEAGLIKLEPGLVLETPYRAATNANLKKAIGEIRESNPIALTAVYGDHGGPQSLALWNGDYLTATALQKMYREFPEETPIRSIFLQCYAGTLIVSPERKRPPFVAGLKSFINHHYPLNRCAYANSHHDELGTYYSWGSKWENSNWSQLFKARPNLSLRILKDFMGQ
ncbi:MAG: hypothetical protein KDD43_14785, partial [Bdellovibrionales bacterium]|nr:hypothetical protein [Bdellovibrionales bacterium]